ncbi:MAG: hypothetical protein M1820_000573 [Bogoriella megaspora]|nr:MAG: hypothetical protein M1820_000573 [Bogoriella megaspora]
MSSYNLLRGAGPADESNTYIEMGPIQEKVITNVYNNIRQSFRFQSKPIKEPLKRYIGQDIKYPFIDAIGREMAVPLKDSYLSPSHGKLRELIVQASDECFSQPNDTTWGRRQSGNTSTWTMRMIGSLDEAKGSGMYVLQWIGTSLALSVTLWVPISSAYIRWNGHYAPFPYSYHGYPKAARNVLEEQPQKGKTLTIVHAQESETDGLVEVDMSQTKGFDKSTAPAPLSLGSRLQRRLRPPRLVILEEFEDESGTTRYRPREMDTAQWRLENKTDTDPEYLFICYTRDHFPPSDVQRLHLLAMKATLDAELRAYWLDSCIPENDQKDLYRIPDYVRQASRVAIVRGHLPKSLQSGYEEDDFGPEALTQMLQVLGQRVWTFPEIILAPGDHIYVYTKGMEMEEGKRIPKMQIADIAFQDAEFSGDLINHFRGTIHLSRLELVATALRCFHTRRLQRWTGEQDQKTNQQRSHEGHFLKGDRAYALAGLLRVRPTADETDSEFQAFARLSLANDSDQILERFICMQPKSSTQSWQTLQDAWNVPLWDILPTCQISAIGEENTVIIDGARGAAVRWKSFAPVAEFKGFSWKRWFSSGFIHGIPVLFWFGVLILIAAGASGIPAALAVGGLFFAVALLLLFLLPKFINNLYSGKVYGHQAWLFGFEGYMTMDQIERKIWHTRQGRLKWSPYGSPLSAHRAIKIVGGTAESRESTHVEGVDPMSDPGIVQHVNYAMKQDGLRLFTIVDTATMTVFLFLAKRPPVAFLICGQEGGMQRAVGVSYDHTTETVQREIVLRMETTILNRMSRVPRCRIGFGRQEGEGKWRTN